MRHQSREWRTGVTLCALFFLVLSGTSFGGPTDVPRILMVGDSWPATMQIFRSFDVMLSEAGIEGMGQRGYSTTLVGVAASEYEESGFLSVLADELNTYPTIDIVHFSLGGNDFVLYSDWTPSMPQDEVNAMFAAINARAESVIDYVLNIRPNIRVAICGYTYGDHPKGGATPAQMNAVWVQFEQSQLAMAQRKDRVFFVHNLGLMQYHYGIPQADPPIPAFSVDYPGGYPDYTPFPGGNPNFNAPLEALSDDDMHLTWQGYDILAKRCIDEFYADWLSWPVVLEILPLADAGKSGAMAQFQVTFSEAVGGVDVTDFSATNGTVTQVEGSGSVYTVSVELTGKTDIASDLQVVDDDTIVDVDNKPLGGAGANNGGFSHNGALSYADEAIGAADDFDAVITSVDKMISCARWILDDMSFAPPTCDINGGLDPENKPYVLGNGLLDSYEFALIQACLRNETLDLSATGGVTHAIALSGWEHNLAQMRTDLGGVDGRVITCIPGVDTWMGGLMTLGDGMSSSLPTLLFTTLQMFMSLPPGAVTPTANNYTLLAQYFGPDGDADGDGASNRAEYQYFVTADNFEAAKQQYIDAALNASQTPPPTEGEGTAEGDTEGTPEGGTEGSTEGATEGATEGEGEGGSGLVDFCATMNDIVATAQSPTFAPLIELLGDNATLIGMLECSVADLNGPFTDTDDPPDGEGDLPGPNGMLDGAYELGVVAELLNHPEAYTGLVSGTMPYQVAAGVDASAVAGAFQNNYDALYNPLAPLLPSLPALVSAFAHITLTPEQTAEIQELFPNLLSVLAAYATLGDQYSLGTADEDGPGVVLFLTRALSQFITTIPTTPDAFQTLNAILSADGDADGDGFTNRQEYTFFMSKSVPGADYVKAVLTPSLNPDHPEEGISFCTIMDDIVTTAQSATFAPLIELLGDNATLIGMLECATADLNGPFTDTDDPADGEGDLPGPNGMLDGSYELGVVAELLNNPGAHAGLATGTLPGQVTAGVDAAAVATAFQANYDALYNPLAPLLPSLPALVSAFAHITLTPEQTAEIQELFPNLLSVLAAYATLGDQYSLGTSDEDGPGVVLFLTRMLSQFITTIPTDPGDFQTLNAILSADGDADGDGFSNRQEYEAFAGVSKGATEYIAAVLDPSITPGTEGEGLAEGEGEGGTVTEGEGEGGTVTEGEGEGPVEGEGEGGTVTEGEGEGGTPPIHTADQNDDGKISLTELLRVIQFFNLRGYHCQAGTEDNFGPGTGDQTCTPHASDYNPQDWKISLTELLRLIQFFNLRGYHLCDGGEDGYCPGATQ